MLAQPDSSLGFEANFAIRLSRGHASSVGSDLHVGLVLSLEQISKSRPLLASEHSSVAIFFERLCDGPSFLLQSLGFSTSSSRNQSNDDESE